MIISTALVTLFLYMTLPTKTKDLTKEFAVKEFLKFIMESLFSLLLLRAAKPLPPLPTVVLPLMLELKFGTYVLKTLLKSNTSKNPLLHGLLLITSNLMTNPNQSSLNPLNPLVMLNHYQLEKKNSGHQLVTEHSNPPLILIKPLSHQEEFLNPSNSTMTPLLPHNHSMDKIPMLKEISELSLTLGNMDKENITLLH